MVGRTGRAIVVITDSSNIILVIVITVIDLVGEELREISADSRYLRRHLNVSCGKDAQLNRNDYLLFTGNTEL